MSDNEFPAITDVIPHRPPMLFLTTITALDPRGGMAEWHISGDEWFLQGHFPGQPIVPGVIQGEAMAQLAAYVVGSAPANFGKIPLLTMIEIQCNVPIVPPVSAVLACQVTSDGKIKRASCQLLVGGRIASEARLAARAVSAKLLPRILAGEGRLGE